MSTVTETARPSTATLPQVAYIASADELRSVADKWDDLWLRSDATCPTVRAATLAQWIESSMPAGAFRAIVVKSEDRFVAALPLVETKLCRLLSVVGLPADNWFPTRGGLLLDGERASDDVLDLLLGAIANLPQQILLIDEVCLELARWRAFCEAAGRAGMVLTFQKQYLVGRIEIDQDWETFRASWSKKHRNRMGRIVRRLSELGKVELEILSNLAPDDVERQLQRGFEIENRSWKGGAGTSVIAAGKFPFFVAQARQLAEWGQLRLVFLNVGGRPIAFYYSIAGKGVWHMFKTAYDPEYAEYSPGMLMLNSVLEEVFRTRQFAAIDLLGVLTESRTHWRPHAYPLGTLMVAPRRMVGRLAVISHKGWQSLRNHQPWQSLRKVKNRLRRRTGDA